MFAKVSSATVVGIEGILTEVEVDVANGIPSFVVVGMPEKSVKESKERVHSAIRNSGYSIPPKKIRINLAPADVRKEGALLDLPIAIGLLSALGHLDYTSFLRDTLIVGELSLEGKLRPVRGILPIAIMAKEMGFEKLILPYGNREEAGMVEGLQIYPVEDLKQAVDLLSGKARFSPYEAENLSLEEQYDVDMKDVKGQHSAKRAIEVACAGGHNLLMFGPPGSGKTMLARRIPTILPPMSFAEALETTRIYSVAGLLDGKLILKRPFRHPHHSISDVGLVGGGSVFSPGEVSLAHNGVLFLDELPEFSRRALEVLRQPLEDGFVVVSRAGYKVRIPASFMLVCAMNPCPCGYHGYDGRCTCTLNQIRNYQSKLSGPLLDRIDIRIEVPNMDYDELKTTSDGESSKSMRERVMKAREIQQRRYEGTPIRTNARMRPSDVRKYCIMDEASENLLRNASRAYGFSVRAIHKILKVARTIADLDGSDRIRTRHIAEAISYRVSKEELLSLKV